MKKVSLASLVLLIAVGLTGAATASDFTGTTVSWQYYAYGGAYTSDFGGGTSSGSFVFTCTTCGNFDGYFTIDTGPNSITFDYTVCASTGECPSTWADSVLSLSPNLYNGIDLLFSGGPSITSVSIDPATNMAGFNTSFLYFTGSEIQVDWHTLPFDSGTIVKLDLNGTTTPEPGSLVLLGSGLLAVAGVLRRRLSL